MRLSELVAALPDELAATHWICEDAVIDPVIRGICYDSRLVSPGDLFVALTGSVNDGHRYTNRALELGAAALVVEREPESAAIGECPTVVVPDSRRALAPLAMHFFGEPSKELDLVGITGTNGKTSTGYLTESILRAAGTATGLIGTVEIRYGAEQIAATNTTPESLDLQRTLRAMRTANIDAVVMEVSSHGLELGRVRGCRFKVAAFTNLTQDHLDFHSDMDAYLASKCLLFGEHLAEHATAVVNLDDPAANAIMATARKSGAEILRCSRKTQTDAEIKLLDAEVRLSGSRARVDLNGQVIDLDLPLLGDFNLENLLVSCGIALAFGVAPDAVASGVAACTQVPGRMELVSDGAETSPTVIVDYAHTPDAIEKLLQAVRPLCEGRLITVFGCGGDRDRGKRPLMADAVAHNSDLTLATSDNPRTEDPGQILRDVEVGLASLELTDAADLGDRNGCYTIIEDRRSAIERAMKIARREDTVIVAGKGHEDYQIVGREKLPFDDRNEVRKALALRSRG